MLMTIHPQKGKAMIHPEPHPHAGKSVVVTLRCRVDDWRQLSTVRVTVADWWDRVHGQSWRELTGNHTAMNYAGRIHHSIPADDEVLLVRYKGHGYLVHESELVGS